MADQNTHAAAGQAQPGDDQPVQYFNSKAFVEKVMADCHLGDLSPELRFELEEEIERSLGERITATIISAFTMREVEMYEQIRDANRGMDQMEALGLVAAKVPGMAQKLLKGIQDLYEELTEDAQRIQYTLDQKEAAKNTKL